METKCLWCWIQRKTFNIINVVLFISSGRRVVNPTLRQMMVVFEDVGVDISLKDCLDEAHIDVISNSASVIYLGSNLVQNFIWNVLIVLYKDLELATTDGQVFICERILDVPADWTELTSVLDDGMEE